MTDAARAGERFQELVEILARLRGPDGCPWDREQDLVSLTDYFLEEVFEAVEAFRGPDSSAAAEELGDVFMEIVFISRIYEERGAFTVADALESIVAKMIRRHPHVFGGEPAGSPAGILETWIQRKKAEKKRSSHFEGLPATAPALHAAGEIGRKAAQTGFDWPEATAALAKVREELDELEEAMTGQDPERVGEEIGDAFFALAQASRLLRVPPETALRRANAKFVARFTALEDRLRRDGREPGEATLEEMEAAWEAIKAPKL